MIEIRGTVNEITNRLLAVRKKGIKCFIVSAAQFQGKREDIYAYI